MDPNPKIDPLGHALLRHRLEQIPGEIAGMLMRGIPRLSSVVQEAKRFVVTGTGSSEAHARYFCSLVNEFTDRAAIFVPQSAFLHAQPPTMSNRTLVLFSQGVSPNAQMVLRRHKEFAHTVLFSSTTPLAARAAGKDLRADLMLDMLESEGELIPYPLGEEDATLVRLVGPMCGYLVCLQFVAELPGSRLAMPNFQSILDLLECTPPASLVEACSKRPQAFVNGFNLLTASPISEFAHNLGYKFTEALFWPCPVVSDFLQFAHGPFQESAAHARPTLILQGDSPEEAAMVEQSTRILAEAGLESHVVHVGASTTTCILGFEAAFNRLILATMESLRIDQINWPGRGKGQTLYGFGTENAS